MQQCQVRVFPQFFVPSFDPNEWCLKNGLHSGGLNPGPLGREYSALTTRPRLLAFQRQNFGLGVIIFIGLAPGLFLGGLAQLVQCKQSF